MRVLVVHNRYQEAGGEDAVVEAELHLLRRFGVPTEALIVDNDEIPPERSVVASARLAAATVWSPSGAARVRHAVRRFRPDVVHFHNTFPLISPAAYSACRDEGVAVVQTLHNYRLICPNALCYRDGRACEDCRGRTPPWPGVRHACYRGSRAQTAVVATMLTVHRLRRTWSRDVDRYVVLSAFARDRLCAGGLPGDRVVVKPNFVDPDPGPGGGGGGILFVGRLVGYKGVPTMLRAWQSGLTGARLRIVGDGPLTGDVERAAGCLPAITYLGRLARPETLAQMQASDALLFPSELYENFPLTIAEAFACGVPVIAARIGAAAELVAEGETGLLFAPGDAADLAAKVAWAAANPRRLREMGLAARRAFVARYTGDANYAMLMEVYAQAGAARREGSG